MQEWIKDWIDSIPEKSRKEIETWLEEHPEEKVKNMAYKSDTEEIGLIDRWAVIDLGRATVNIWTQGYILGFEIEKDREWGSMKVFDKRLKNTPIWVIERV